MASELQYPEAHLFLRVAGLQRPDAATFNTLCFTSLASLDEIVAPAFLGRNCSHLVRVGDRIEFNCGGDRPVYGRAVVVGIKKPDRGQQNGEVHLQLMGDVVHGRVVEPPAEAA